MEPPAQNWEQLAGTIPVSGVPVSIVDVTILD